MTLLND